MLGSNVAFPAEVMGAWARLETDTGLSESPLEIARNMVMAIDLIFTSIL